MKLILTILSIVLFAAGANAQLSLAGRTDDNAFPLATAAGATPVLYDRAEDPLIAKVVQLFSDDIFKVTGKTPEVGTSVRPGKRVLVIGTLRSKWISELVAANKLAVTELRGKWEAFAVQVVRDPFAGVAEALVIVGSDRRGAAYGMLELSRLAGVSPWHWWANVPVKQQQALYIKANGRFTDAPKVKYRGIFINDEAPALSTWSREKFGGFNHLFYEKVFELLLRSKANYLWPAMWGNAFYDDDSLNRQTAQDWGIVIGTSHHEPLMRAHDEWRRTGGGKWSYDSNSVRLQQFWRGGMQRATNEKIVTVGMRGDGDEPMSRETATALLERIVADQRSIIAETTGKPANETPQLWALYKEVQDYYDKGMRVPDDVTLLLCDDNWGNIRRLPQLDEKPRKGGYGIYYHFDYVGGPRNYKWLNTNNIARVWEQMHLAYEHRAREIWIVNVGDIKPMELPISFFLDHAWNPERFTATNLRSYYTQWASEQFGASNAKEISDILRLYAQYSARRKPELLSPDTYHLFHYNEAGRVLAEQLALVARAEKIYSRLPQASKDAYYDLVLHPVKAAANLAQLYNAVAWNRYYAARGQLAANAYADSAKAFFIKDSLLTKQYHAIAGGKWNGLMLQTHIGYTYWQQPETNSMPAVQYVSPDTATSVALPLEAPTVTAIHLVPKGSGTPAFFEKDGVVAMEAAHWSRAFNTPAVKWQVIEDIGRTGAGISTFPVTARGNNTSPFVEYDFYTYDTGAVQLHLYFSPTLDFHHTGGLKYAVSIDGAQPQVMTLNAESGVEAVWETWVARNIIEKVSQHHIKGKGRHTLRYRMVSPGVVLQKAVIDFGGLKESYLGPPETLKK